MEKIDKNVRKVTRKIKKLYGESPDLNTRIIDIQGQKIGCLFFESSSFSFFKACFSNLTYFSASFLFFAFLLSPVKKYETLTLKQSTTISSAGIASRSSCQKLKPTDKKMR